MNNFLPDLTQLAQKRALITGGTSGIGLATALLLAKHGVRLYIIGRDEEKLEQALEQIKDENEAVEVYGMSVDVTEASALEKLFDSIDKHWGGLDILINNAALGHGSILEGAFEDWNYLVKTNITAYLACCNYAAKRMLQQNDGHIINIGSMSAEARQEGSSVYVASKSALQGFSEAFRKEINNDGICVTLIEPGAVDTPMQDSSQEEKDEKIQNLEMLLSEDVARSVLYVLSQPKRCAIVDLKIRPLKQLI
ncbi:SDR family oxidoreductase [Nubsella zeaxanthinifaciens]|uniref:SDR family oxidoreductase n=1 Tax=Nubsella zeaxanthinifaciens TaxID=392412 RepID=UPI003D05204A